MHLPVVVDRAYWLLTKAWRGFGRPFPQESWEQRYRSGGLDFMDSLPELAHYMVIVGYLQHLFKSPAILDVGCGPGKLSALLRPFSFERYVGVDLSAEAIKRASRHAAPNATFEVGDFAVWAPRERYDAVIFNEVLHYAEYPADVLSRYAAEALKPGGVSIVSLHRAKNYLVIWQTIKRRFDVLDWTTVTNAQGLVWDIGLFRARARSGPAAAAPQRGREPAAVAQESTV